MAKRFIDTGFYKSPFVRSLKGPLKGLYSFIICDCDGSGIWAKDLPIASAYIGFEISEQDFKIFVDSGKAIDLKNGKYFFPDFIEHQYPQGLQDKNPAHKNFIYELKKFHLIDNNLKPLPRPFEGSKVMVKAMVMDKVVEEVKETVKVMEVVMPFESEKFSQHWEFWKTYKKDQFKFTYKSSISEQAALNDLVKLSGGEENKAIQIIMQSMANSWKGFFEIKNNSNGTTKNGKPDYGSPERAKEYDRLFAERYPNG